MVRHDARVVDLRQNTKHYSQEAREALGLAVIRAREAAGYKWRPSFVAVAKISLRSLVKLETGIPVGPAVYEAVARALPGWTEDTPRAILAGAPAPPATVVRDVNEEVLRDLLELGPDLLRLGERAEEPVMRFLESREPDRDKRMRTWNAFITEVRQQQEGGGT